MNLSFDLTSHPASLALAIMTAAAHFMECLLLQVYANPDIFDYDHGITLANFTLSAIALVAIIQAYFGIH